MLKARYKISPVHTSNAESITAANIANEFDKKRPAVLSTNNIKFPAKEQFIMIFTHVFGFYGGGGKK